MPSSILIVASDKTAVVSYANLFNKKEFTVYTATSGRQAVAQAKAHRLDILVVDVASRINCKAVCRKVKSESSAPLIAIAAASAKIDSALTPIAVVQKPVSGKKLLARVKTVLENKPPRLLKAAGLTIDVEKHKLTRGNKRFSLTPKEFILIKLFIAKAGQIVTRKMLMREVWETDYLGDTRTLDVHIRWLREKIEDNASKPQRLLTVRGQGYKFVAS
ncbi:MAG: response regulator transcription factor [Chloroflexi bacterium]|nr:response regulator transcription factor [Chloroflexota bacterium]